MESDSEFIITTNQIEAGSPSEFLSRVRAISTAVRRFRAEHATSDETGVAQASTVLFDDLVVEMTSESQQAFTLQLHRDSTKAVTTIEYAGSSLFVQRAQDEEPEQMKPDAEGFGVVQFVTTIIDKLRDEAHPDDIIW